MDRNSQLFDINRYSDDAEICFSINGDTECNAFNLSESICSRIICIGEAYQDGIAAAIPFLIMLTGAILQEVE